jgi:hypothetical protein
VKDIQDTHVGEALKLVKAFFSIASDKSRRELVEMAEHFSNLEKQGSSHTDYSQN